MKVNIQTKGVVITAKQKSVIEKKLLRLKRYVKEWSPVVCDVKLMDQTGENRGGIDQAIHIKILLPRETIFIEEVDDRMMRAFGFAYQTLERKLKRYKQKHTSDRRRQASKFKAVVNVVGAPWRAVGSAGRSLGRYVPKRRSRTNKKNKKK